MKYLRLTFLLMFLAFSSAQAASDSVAVFHRPEKVMVLLKEWGSAGRLQQFLDAVGAQEGWQWFSPDESVKIECARAAAEAGCNIRLLPSDSVRISGRAVHAQIHTGDFVGTSYEMSFESSREDRFHLKIDDQGLQVWAGKRGQQP